MTQDNTDTRSNAPSNGGERTPRAASKPRSHSGDTGGNTRRRPQPVRGGRQTEEEPFIRRAIPDMDTPFTQMGIDPRVAVNLDGLGIKDPSPIQAEAIPAIIAGRDLLGLAQTGTGKTAAFGLPMLTRLLQKGSRAQPKACRALILAPTRELAGQIAENIAAYAQGTGLRAIRVVGGASINTQTNRLGKGADILIATPGRLIDLLDRGAVSLDQTSYLVLDEADQMLDIGFIHALRRIARLLPPERQTLLFSATMPKLMSELADSYLQDPVRVAVNPPGQAGERITQGVHFVSQGEKSALLAEYINKHPGELAIVFNRTKHGSDKLARFLDGRGFKTGAIHGNKSQNQRERALKQFRNGEIHVLVATDVAARGLDIPEVEHIYNYDLPNVAENYVHRIGRTARAGRKGRAIAFCGPDEQGELRDIERAMKAEIPTVGGERPSVLSRTAKPKRGGGGGGGGRPGGATKRPARRPSRQPRARQS